MWRISSKIGTSNPTDDTTLNTVRVLLPFQKWFKPCSFSSRVSTQPLALFMDERKPFLAVKPVAIDLEIKEVINGICIIFKFLEVREMPEDLYQADNTKNHLVNNHSS